MALLYASKQLDDVKNTQNFDQKIGVDIVRKALQVPLKTIANNAGGLTLCKLLPGINDGHVLKTLRE